MNREMKIAASRERLKGILATATSKDSADLEIRRSFGSNFRIEQWGGKTRKAFAYQLIEGKLEIIEAEASLG